MGGGEKWVDVEVGGGGKDEAPETSGVTLPSSLQKCAFCQSERRVGVMDVSVWPMRRRELPQGARGKERAGPRPPSLPSRVLPPTRLGSVTQITV